MLRAYCAPATAFAVLSLSEGDAPGLTTGLSLPDAMTALQFEPGTGITLAFSRAIHLFSSVGRHSKSLGIAAIRRRSPSSARTAPHISGVANGPNTFLTSALGLIRNWVLCDPPKLAQLLCASFTVPWGRSAADCFFFRVFSSNLWLVPVNGLVRPGD